MKVTVIGAGGHVGLPFSLVVANAGHTVFGVDLNEKIVDQLNKGKVPYIEHGAEEALRYNIEKERIFFTTDPGFIKDSDVVAIMLGTPVDEENNPRLDSLFDFIDNTLIPNIKKKTLIILRSTVAPGTTEIVRDHIENQTDWIEGVDFYLTFIPERVLQTKGIEETGKLPTLIGAFNRLSFLEAQNFIKSFNKNECFELTPKEAEIGKLMTNMYRYVTFAFANEMWMIGEKQGVNIDKVIDACNYGYERMAVPYPGPNVGGPCLFKDGRFLLSDVPFGDLINTSFLINEGMPDYLFNRIKTINPNIKNVLILGATFKKDCDDTRNSLSFKMKKVCKKHGVKVDIVDPYIGIIDTTLAKQDYNAVIVMTPHTHFLEKYRVNDFKQGCIIADLWKMFPESKLSNTGIYTVGDVK
jgi:UDP-N-acetyl-D-mannosaminuronic acid dehydrogenase